MGANGRPGRVFGVWAIIVVVCGVAAATLLPGVLSPDIRLTNGPASERAAGLMAQRLAPATDTELFVVTSTSSTVDDPAFRAVVERLQSGLEALGPRVVSAAVTFYQTKDADFVSKDRRATLVPTVIAGRVGDATKKIPALRKVGTEVATSGFSVYLAGNASAGEEVVRTTKSRLGTAGSIAFVVVLLLLAIALGSLAAVTLPLGITIGTSAVALGLVAVVGQLAPFMALAPLAVFVVGLAIAIMQSTFVVSRYRQERANGLEREVAAGVASAAGGRSALIAGVAVCLGLAPMLFVPANVIRSVAGATIFLMAAATVAAKTLVPALLARFGGRIDRRPLRRAARPGDGGHGVVGWLARAATAAPAAYLVVGVVILFAFGLQWGRLRVGTPSPTTLPSSSEAAHAIAVLAVNFPTVVQPVDVVVDGAASDPIVAAGVKTLTARMSHDQVFGPTMVTDGRGIVVVSAPLFADPTGNVAVAAVQRVRTDYVAGAFEGVPVYVGGPTAGFKDQADAAGADLPLVIGLSLVALFAVLVVALRSILVSLLAVAFNLLTTAAMFGITEVVFQRGVGAHLLSFPKDVHVFTWIPMLVYSDMFTLTASASVFLLASIRECRRQGLGPHDAVIAGVSSAGRPLAAASLILLPLLVAIASVPNIIFQQGAFAVLVGLLIDAVIVRLVLFPAAISVLGKRAWS